MWLDENLELNFAKRDVLHKLVHFGEIFCFVLCFGKHTFSNGDFVCFCLEVACNESDASEL